MEEQRLLAAKIPQGPRRRRHAAGSVLAAAAVATLGRSAFLGPDPGPPKTKVKVLPLSSGAMDLEPAQTQVFGRGERFDDSVGAAVSAWTGVARRAARRRPAAAAVSVAWRRTMRLAAIGLGLPVVVRGIHGAGRPKRPRRSKEPRLDAELDERDGREVCQALKRLDLPFFATGVRRADVPERGVKISGNVRTVGAPAEPTWGPEAGVAVRGAIEEALGRPVRVSLLRVEDEVSEVPRFELLVSAARTGEESVVGGLPVAAGSLAVAAACTAALGGSLQLLGTTTLAPGAVAPVALLCGLPLAGEAVRFAVAQGLGVRLSLPTFLPSPQIGIIGSHAVSEDAPDRSSAMALSLAAPLTVAALSGVLLLCGGGGDSLAVASGSNLVWPLAVLPSQCDPLAFAGSQGLVMAAYALLPHSPDGQIAWSCVIGRERADRLREVSSYLHPSLGLLANWACGQGWGTLPIVYAFLLINFAASPRPPPLEEATEVPGGARLGALLLLLAALVCAFPAPVHELMAMASSPPADLYY